MFISLRKPKVYTIFKQASKKLSITNVLLRTHDETDFYNSQKSQPIHPLLKNQETALRKGQIILTNQVLTQKKTSKTKATFFMDIGEKNLLPYDLKPWIKHQLSSSTYNSLKDNELNTMKKMFFGWNQFRNLSKTLIDSNSNRINYKDQTWLKCKESILKWLKQQQLSTVSEIIEQPYFYTKNAKHQNTISLPHVTRQLMYYNTTWTWLTRCWKKNHLVTGRIGRSLRNAGTCVLLGGFIAFLPKGESLLKQKRLKASQGGLKLIQPIGMRYQNLNIVVTRDKGINSIWYRFSKYKFM